MGIGLGVRAILVQQPVTVFVSSGVCFSLPFEFFLKTLIMALRPEFDDDNTFSESVFTLVTRLKRDRYSV